MLEPNLITSEAKRVGISPDRVAREAWEVLVLNELSQAPWSKQLVFKGGTALRIAWNSPRFSEDLDFSLTSSITETEFRTFCGNLPKKFNRELETQDITKKQLTLFALFRIREPFLTNAFTLKLEISTRLPYQPKSSYELKLLKSDVLPQQVLVNVSSLESLWDDKVKTFGDRNEPRDLFDIWYLSQILKRPFPKFTLARNPMDVKQELNKLLPLSYRPVVSELLALCKPSSKNSKS